MKANAPEIIWIDLATDLPKLSGHIDKDSVEYIRKDAFIEKAIEYIITHIPDMHTLGIAAKMDECIIEDFRKYMEE